jgi:putative CocE/NonD family hydrolase
MTTSLPPKAIRHHETIWIPLADGTRLAGRLWIPEDAEMQPVPAILEYIPYRRRDGTRDGDDLTHPYLAAHGYACLRLDIRGTGDSEGVIRDEYLKQEQDDALEAIAWLAKQSWCNGNVGMMGISWGGFNALQVAARRPPALKAIMTACSTDDRYADDMHYMGGCHMTGNLEWGSSFFSIMGRSPDPLVVGDRWRQMWMQRLEAVTPVFATWLHHQRRDDYWRHGSVCEDIGAITCAVLAVGGWADGYTNAVFRLLRELKSPRLAIVGPWGHKYPHNGVPGPAIGFLTECLRWWDHWLKGRDTGIMAEPMLRAYVQDSVAPASHYDHRPGHWVAEPSWPSQAIVQERLTLNSDGLAKEPGEVQALSVNSPETTGAAGGEWCPYGLGGLGPELPTDQRPDDAYSLCFDGKPLKETLEILGAPTVELELAANRPVANLIVRLNDVAPDGSVTRVSYGVLNLTHRGGHSAPEPLEPDQRQRVQLQLNDIGHRFLAGHRIRVAVSTAYWPIIWPAPAPVRLTLWTAHSSLLLPVRRPRPEDSRVVFAEPERPTPTRRRMQKPGAVHRSICQDVASGEQRIEVLRDDGTSIIEEIGVETALRKIIRYWMRPDDPSSARAEVEHDLTNRHPQGWDSRIRTRCAIACTATEFVVEADLEAFEAGIRLFSRSWTERIARDMC